MKNNGETQNNRRNGRRQEQGELKGAKGNRTRNAKRAQSTEMKNNGETQNNRRNGRRQEQDELKDTIGNRMRNSKCAQSTET